MDTTAPPIFELGVVLLVAAAAGWVARRLRLPAVIGYLAVGLAISPFTPGYVADRAQLQLLADVGVVLLLFEVGIEVDLARLRGEHGGLLWAAPAQAILTTVVATGAGIAAGLPPFGAGLVGLGIALSSSVVIVNITRSRRRTTFRDLLAVLFFVAIGTLIDPTALGRGVGWVAFVVGLILVAKVLVAYVLARAARLRANPLQLAVGLGQVGEFSFVLASVGLAAGVVPAELYAAVLTSVAITIVVSTVVVRLVGDRSSRSEAPAAAG